jgi:hypothetical protein
MAKDEPKDQRHIDRDAELARQAEQEKAMQAFYKQNKAEAEEALRRQGQYEATGVRTVDSKP